MSIFPAIMTAIYGNRAPQDAPGIETVLATKAQQDAGKEELNWKFSIVDFLRLLDLDSSLDKRKELAQELGYPGIANGSSEMNIWLHKQCMRKIAENGGNVPSTLYE
jgi:hypothetical protein